MVNILFSKVIGENEKCIFYVYLKTKRAFGQPNRNLKEIVSKQYGKNYDMCKRLHVEIERKSMLVRTYIKQLQ